MHGPKNYICNLQWSVCYERFNDHLKDQHHGSIYIAILPKIVYSSIEKIFWYPSPNRLTYWFTVAALMDLCLFMWQQYISFTRLITLGPIMVCRRMLLIDCIWSFQTTGIFTHICFFIRGMCTITTSDSGFLLPLYFSLTLLIPGPVVVGIHLSFHKDPVT